MCKLHCTQHYLCCHSLTTFFTPCSRISPLIDSPELCPYRTISLTHNTSTLCPACAHSNPSHPALPGASRIALTSPPPEMDKRNTGSLHRQKSVHSRPSLHAQAQKAQRRSQFLPPSPPYPPRCDVISTQPVRNISARLSQLHSPHSYTLSQGSYLNPTSRPPTTPTKPIPQTAIEIGCEALGYTKVIVDDGEEPEERELSDEEIYERRVEALRMLGSINEDERKGSPASEMFLRPMTYTY